MTERSSEAPKPAPEGTRARHRVRELDALRGVATIAMIVWHAADAWSASEGRGDAFRWIEWLGGTAAPSFFLLAGVSLALDSAKTNGLARTLRRALELVILGFALDLWALGVDRGGVIDPARWLAMLGSAMALGALVRGLESSWRERIVLGVVVLGGVGLVHRDPIAARVLLRLDVLHGIAVAVAATALAVRILARLGRAFAIAALTLVAFAIAAIAPSDLALAEPLRSVVGGDVRGAFPLVPWAAYTALGAAFGLTPLAHDARRWNTWCAGFASVAASFAFAAHAAHPRGDLVSFGAHVAMLMTAAWALCYSPRLVRTLEPLGRHSLPVYCMHLTVTYGLFGIPLQGRVPAPLALALAVVVTLVLAWIVIARERSIVRRLPCRAASFMAPSEPLMAAHDLSGFEGVE